MCIEKINENRKNMGLKEITGEKNIQMLELLMPEAECVATFKQWKNAGRIVKKGEKAFKLRGSTTFKDKKTGKKEVRFYNFNVFEKSQTMEIEEED